MFFNWLFSYNLIAGGGREASCHQHQIPKIRGRQGSRQEDVETMSSLYAENSCSP